MYYNIHIENRDEVKPTDMQGTKALADSIENQNNEMETLADTFKELQEMLRKMERR